MIGCKEVEVNETDSASGIYAITHVASGKQYIGSAANIQARWAVHRTQLKQGSHHSRYLQRAWNHHGENAFVFVVLERVTDRDMLIMREQAYLDERFMRKNSHEYNMSPCASSRLGITVSEESRARMRAAGRKNAMNTAWRARISAGRRGIPWSTVRWANWLATPKRPLTEAQKRGLEIGRDLARSGERTDMQREWTQQLNMQRRGRPWSVQAYERVESRITGFREHNQRKAMAAQERADAIIKSYDALTEAQGDTLSLWQCIQLIATEHSTSYATVYRAIRARYPDLVISQADKGEATRERVAQAVREYEAATGRLTTSTRELARILASSLDMPPGSVRNVLRRLRRSP